MNNKAALPKPSRNTLYASLLAAIALPTAANAQDRQLEEVLVTAQKRVESLQDIPLSVTAISAQDLEIMGIQDSADLTKASASLTYTEAGSKQESSFRIRGIGTSVYSISVEPSVAVVIDNISQIQAGQAFTNLVDVERVEVLRGPQSTLFGKNASAGLINVVTRKSSNALEGFVEASYTDDDEVRVKGAVSGPIGGTLGYRLTGFYTDFAGYAKNLYLDNEDINGKEAQGFRGRLDWVPTADLELNLIAYSSSEEDDCCTPTHRRVDPGALFAGIVPFELMNPLTTPSKSNQDPETDTPPESKTDDQGFSLQADWRVGEHTLTSITAVNDWEYEFTEDQDWSGFDFSQILPFLPSGGIVANSWTETELFSQEFRLLSPSDGNWEYMVGLYYADAETHREYENSFPLTFISSEATTSTETVAAFGQLTWRMTDNTHLTLGGRYNDEEYTVAYLEEDPAGGIVSDYSDQDADDVILGKLALQHYLNDESMLFASVTEGYKGGAFEVGGGSEKQPIEPETSISYEIGAKTELLDRRLQLNVTGFYSTYEDYQAQRTVFVNNELRTTLTNVGELESKGVEIDSVALIGENLTLTFGLAWIDATIKDYPGANCYPGQTEEQGCIELIPGDRGTRVQDLAGKDLNNSPEWKFNLGARYDIAFSTLPFDGFVTGAYFWQDELNFSISNNPDTMQDSYGIANFSIGIAERENNRYSATLFVNNAFDESYASAIADLSPIYGDTKTLMHHLPRGSERYAGLRLRFGF